MAQPKQILDLGGPDFEQLGLDFKEFESNAEPRWQCAKCLRDFEDEQKAKNCHPPTLTWICRVCGFFYLEQETAESCHANEGLNT